MIRRCVEVGLPEPQFAVTDEFLTTVHRATLADHAGGQVGHAGGQAGHAGGQALLSTKDAAMLRACDREAVPGEELLAAAGYSRRTGDFRRRLERLLNRGCWK